MAIAQSGGGYLERPRPSGLADVIDVILDKGLVIDAYVRVSLIGIEILTIDARIVIASVDTYLRFAEAVNRLDLVQADDSQGLPELMESMTEGGSKSKSKGALEGVKEALSGGDDDDSGEDDKQKSRTRRSSSSSGSSSSRSSSRSRSRKSS
jgi:gas vesicle structural protein